MLRALRVVSVERGHDPAAFALVAYGGAGPLHARTRCGHPRPVLVPEVAGVLSALAAPWRVGTARRARSYLVPTHRLAADLRYEGQSFELTLPLGDPAEAFHRARAEGMHRRTGVHGPSRPDIRPGPDLDLPRTEQTKVAGSSLVALPGSTCWLAPGWVGARDGRMLRLTKQ